MAWVVVQEASSSIAVASSTQSLVAQVTSSSIAVASLVAQVSPIAFASFGHAASSTKPHATTIAASATAAQPLAAAAATARPANRSASAARPASSFAAAVAAIAVGVVSLQL